MWSYNLHNLQGAEVWRAPKYVDPRGYMRVEAPTEPEIKQAKSAMEWDEMPRLESFPLTDDEHISKKHFRPGGMAPSEWTRSVRAVRDTPVADSSVPGVHTMRRVAYRPPIAVLQFLLALSVSYFKQTLWGCGQL